MGGNTNAANMKFTDSGFEKNDPSRTIDKTQGAGTVALPEEYRNAIEAYFKKRSNIKSK